jgi:hypothetical protein
MRISKSAEIISGPGGSFDSATSAVRVGRSSPREPPRKAGVVRINSKGVSPMRVYDPHKSTVEVRQGDRKQGTKFVLVISTVAVIVAFGLIWWWFAVYGGGNSINHGV